MKTVADSVNNTRKTFGLDSKKHMQEGIFFNSRFFFFKRLKKKRHILKTFPKKGKIPPKNFPRKRNIVPK
jgi:hypothetical protein